MPFYQLMKDLHGLDVEDPGAPVGSKDKLEAALHSAGFSTVKVGLGALCVSINLKHAQASMLAIFEVHMLLPWRWFYGNLMK